MKRSLYGFAILLVVACLAPSGGAWAQDDIRAHRSCAHCGMDRKAFGYSRMLVEYTDGTAVGVCSLRCAAVELGAHPDREVKTLWVADRDTRELLDAAAATWVLGGDKSGVMTRNPKWAFAIRAGADAFVAAHGGTVVPWQAALDAARQELPR